MKISVEKWTIDENVFYKTLKIEKCCDRVITSENITLNNEYCENDTYSDDNEYAVKLVRNEHEYDGYDETYYEKIDYCPFCGEKIEIDIVNTVDKTEEYKTLREERDLLWKKCCKTDSKKTEYKLRNQVRDLDLKINKMLQSDDFVK